MPACDSPIGGSTGPLSNLLRSRSCHVSHQLGHNTTVTWLHYRKEIMRASVGFSFCYNDDQGCWYRFRHNLLVSVFFFHPVRLRLIPSYSCVGVWQNNQVEIIPNDHGNRITPSYVSFAQYGRSIGDAAKNQAARNPRNTYVYRSAILSQCRRISFQPI